MAQPLKLVYWDIRGLGEAIRNLLRYAQIPFDDVRLQFGNGTDQPIKEPFHRDRHRLATEFAFPNLPYLIDGPVKLTQSQAIIKYLARKYGLCAPADDNAALALEEMTELQIIDIRNRLIMPLFRTYTDDAKWRQQLTAIKQQFVEHFTELERFLQDKTWLTGDRLSYVDFLGYEYLDWYRVLIEENAFETYPKLAAYMARFEELKPLKEYLASDAYRKANLVSPSGYIRSREDRK